MTFEPRTPLLLQHGAAVVAGSRQTSWPRKRLRDEQPKLESGGAIALGKLASAFNGLKKAHLVDAGFAVGGGEKGFGDFTVCEDAATLEAALAASTPLTARVSLAAKEACLNAGDPLAADIETRQPPALTLELLMAITSYVQACGGIAALGNLTTLFEGVKKVQLEPHFQVTPIDPLGDQRSGNFCVGLLPGQANLWPNQQVGQWPSSIAGVAPALFPTRIGLAGVQSSVPRKKKKKRKAEDELGRSRLSHSIWSRVAGSHLWGS